VNERPLTAGSCFAPAARFGRTKNPRSSAYARCIDGAYPPPAVFRPETSVEETEWLDPLLTPHGEQPPSVGFIVPRGFDAYVRVLHPARRILEGRTGESVPLRWSEIAEARAKTIHPEVGLRALLDHRDEFDDDYWRSIGTGGGEWFPPYEWLEEPEALAIVSLLRSCTTTAQDAWFMLWDGYGDLGPMIEGLPRGTIHRAPDPPDVPAELVGRTWAFRHYLVFRGPLDALSTWFAWRSEGPNYLWPDDRAWIVATEIDGFSTYVGGPGSCIDRVLTSPLLESVTCELADRFDGIGDPINGEPS
jgi:hypothetical protein